MRVLSIDSSLGTQVAVLDVPEQAAASVLACQEQGDARRHAESLGPMLASVLGDPQVADQPLDLVVVACGPAPFTGLRAGIVAARSVGRARGVPVLGVPSLDAVARLALDRLRATGAAVDVDPQPDPVVLVVTDARRREVYAARYRACGPDDVTRLDALSVCPPTQALGLGPCDAVAGSGAAVCADMVEGNQVVATVSGSCRTQVRVALSRLARGEELPDEPLYLRHADVHVPAGPRPAGSRGPR